MKLKSSLRRHYTLKEGKWVPKRAFESIDDAAEQLGFKLEEIDAYECPICNKMHIATPYFVRNKWH